MNKRTDGIASFANEFSLLKLAYNTLTCNFTQDRLRKAFSMLLFDSMTRMGVTYFLCTEFAKILFSGKMPEFISDNDIADAIKLLKRKYKISKNIFSSRLTYKYYFLFELAYILKLSGMKRNSYSFTILYAKLKINEEEQELLKKYVAALETGEFSVLPGILDGTKLKNHSITIRPLNEFIIREYNYYNLPRRNISVFSTMSAGKSTFINALLGHDYLPAKNEACTAKIVSVADIDNINYSLGHVVKNGNPVVCGNVDDTKIEEWNCDSDVSEIMLEGDLDRISSEKIVTVIHDTPGINYSGNTNHKEITIRHLQNVKPDIIIFLLDATQMETTDFNKALLLLKKSTGMRKRFATLFIVNKTDKLDPEKENLVGMMISTKETLEKNGFLNPVIIPVSSRAAWLLKRAQKSEMKWTKKEKSDFVSFMSFFGDNGENFCKATIGFPCDKMTVENINTSEGVLSIGTKSHSAMAIQRALINTGIPVVESFLNSYNRRENEQGI
jgi:ribosome biogenesis GTPase A